jgi:uncharacterized protein with von Willebrand factor type A (vWA) domain
MLIAASTNTIFPGAVLHTRLAGFAGFLHDNGFDVGGNDATRILEAALRVGVFDGDVLRWSLKALLCSRGDEWRRFDALFDAYFRRPNTRAYFDRPDRYLRARSTSGIEAGDIEVPSAANDAAPGANDDHALRQGASPRESLASTDFRDLHRADDVRAIEALMRRFARRLKHVRMRREEHVARGRALDLPRTIRRSIGSGGTPFRLHYRDRRRVRPRLVLLLDVSRSMSQYSFFHLRLARALVGELADVHCFIFHTRITGIGAALRDPDPWRAQERLHLLAAGWGGGTRIGECLRDFNAHHAPRLVHSRTGVIVVSDGYDTGEPGILDDALASLHRRARSLVWLNPLLGQPGFEPKSRGMQAALPHLDALLPGSDLTSISRILPGFIEALR